MDVRYMHRLAPRACGKVYTILSGPPHIDGGFDVDKTAFHEPEGARCTCAAGGKRSPVTLHMLNQQELDALELKTDKDGTEYVECDIAMEAADDEDDGLPHVAEHLPFVEAEKPAPKPRAKPKAKPKAKPAAEKPAEAPKPEPEPWVPPWSRPRDSAARD